MVVGIEVQRLFRKERFGIETSALELLHELNRLNTKHKFVVFVKHYKAGNNYNDTTDLTIKELNGRLFFDFEQFFLPLALNRNKIDILHCTGNTTPLICHKPIVQTLHDIIFMDEIPFSDSLYQRAGNLYRRFVVPFSVKKSKAIITVSHHEKERIINRFQLDEKKIHVVYNGVSSEFNKETKTEDRIRLKEKYKLPDAFILFLGNTSARKNPIGIIESYLKYRKLTENPLPIVTPGLSNNFIETHLRKLKLLNEIKNFHTPGYIERSDLPHLYAMSSVFLFPSFSEGFGMPVLEAMASRVPVITSNVSSLPEIAGNAALLVNPYDTNEIAAAILKLTSDLELQRKNIENGIKHASKFSWKKSAEMTLELYEKVMDQ